MDFTDFHYLKQGNTTQQEVYYVLEKYESMQQLSVYTPIVAGTIPISIDVPGSDIDILCEYSNTDSCVQHIENLFSKHFDFSIECREVNGTKSVIANFSVDGFDIEIFGQNLPVTQQAGYRHMIVEYHILREKDDMFRQQVIALKQQGVKTEPAFAQLLGLKGDPYQALLDFEVGNNPEI
jgi:hypothetical protein